MAKVQKDVRLIFDDQIAESIAVKEFIDREVRRLNISGGWAGYMMQLATAAMLTRDGDMTLAGMLAPGVAMMLRPAAPQPMPETHPAASAVPGVNTSAIVSKLDGAFD